MPAPPPPRSPWPTLGSFLARLGLILAAALGSAALDLPQLGMGAAAGALLYTLGSAVGTWRRGDRRTALALLLLGLAVVAAGTAAAAFTWVWLYFRLPF